MTATMLVRGLEEAGLPAGVVNLFTAIRARQRAYIKRNCARRIFTGSTKVGKMIARSASNRCSNCS